MSVQTTQPQAPTALLDSREAADVLGCSRSAVYSLALPRVRLGPRTVRWRACDLEEELPMSDEGSNATNETLVDLRTVREDLLTVEEVAELLSVPVKRVYRLPISRVELGPNTVRWRPEDVSSFIKRCRVAA